MAGMFEEEGVALTERSIIDWGEANKMVVARRELFHYFDPTDGNYFISDQEVKLAIDNR